LSAAVSPHVPAPHLLIVDDDEGMLVLMSETLRAEGYRVTTASSGRAALAALESPPPDLMILDLKLQDVDATTLVEKLRAAGAPVPFVVVTGQGDEKVAVEVMKHGALDYVMKDTGLLDLLPAVARGALDAIAQQKALAAAREEHRRLENEIVAASERERHTIGADLHDNLGQQLTAIELMCAAAKEDAAAHPPVAYRLDQISRMLREAIAQTRFLARGLVPIGSDPDALQISLAELAERTNALGRARCTFESPEAIALSDARAAGHLYRIAQEAVNNALKHARARHISIRLVREPGALALEISDDGAGLSKTQTGGAGSPSRPEFQGGSRAEIQAASEKAPHPAGVGLGVMQHRASAIGAELTIASKRGGGVTIACRLPLKR